MTRTLTALCLAVVACSKPAAPPAQSAPTAKVAQPITLKVLVTGREAGHLLPSADAAGVLHGGAAQVLARWVRDEGHCVGRLREGGASACPNGNTLVLSTGDNVSGAAISTYFRGESTADFLATAGYAASALGNRDLDFGRPSFKSNQARAGVTWLTSNVTPDDDEAKGLGLKTHLILERRGVKVGVVGLTSPTIASTVFAGRFNGLTVVDADVALSVVVPELWKAGAKAVVVLTDGCNAELAPVVAAHPEWRLSLVAGRACDAPFPPKVGDTVFTYPGSHWAQYVSATLQFDGATQKLLSTEAKVVEVLSDAAAPPPEPTAAQQLRGWEEKLDAALGAQLAFTKTGLEQTSAQMASWLTTALKESFNADVGLLNRKGIRASLAPGIITQAHLYDVLPFDNVVVVSKVSGAQLKAALENVEARYAGMRETPKGFVDGKGKLLDEKAQYAVATSDFLYLGGDGFALKQADGGTPLVTEVAQQAAVIEWTRKLGSTEALPLEAALKKR